MGLLNKAPSNLYNDPIPQPRAPSTAHQSSSKARRGRPNKSSGVNTPKRGRPKTSYSRQDSMAEMSHDTGAVGWKKMGDSATSGGLLEAGNWEFD